MAQREPRSRSARADAERAIARLVGRRPVESAMTTSIAVGFRRARARSSRPASRPSTGRWRGRGRCRPRRASRHRGRDRSGRRGAAARRRRSARAVADTAGRRGPSAPMRPAARPPPRSEYFTALSSTIISTCFMRCGSPSTIEIAIERRHRSVCRAAAEDRRLAHRLGCDLAEVEPGPPRSGCRRFRSARA